MRTGALIVTFFSAALSMPAQAKVAKVVTSAEVRLASVRVKGALQQAAVRRGLKRRFSAARRCARLLRPGRSWRPTATLTVKDGKVTTIKTTGTATAGLRRCLHQALRGFAGASGDRGTITARLQLFHRSGAAARRAKIARALARLGKLKILGTMGRGGGVSNLIGTSNPFGGVSGLTVSSPHSRRQRERRAQARVTREKLMARALRVPEARGRPAPWAQPELARSRGAWFPQRRRTVAMSAQMAIVSVSLSYQPVKAETRRTATIYLAVHRTRGLLGQVTPPANVIKWDIDPQGAVRVVTRDGQLHSARTTDAASRPGGWTALARIDGATWDLAPKLIVAAKDQSVHVSTDGGKTFSKRKVPTTSRLRQLVVRFDGVIVVRGADGTFISPDRGLSWARSSFQPGHLSRKGAWIHASNACGGEAVLSADKRTWVMSVLPPVLGRYGASGGQSRSQRRMTGWEALVDTGVEPLARAPGRHPTPSDPPPPPLTGSSVKAVGAPQPCKRGGARIGGLGLRGGAPGGGCGYGARGKGFLAQCVRGTIGREPGVSSLWIGWLTDGMTGAGARPPSLVVVDHRRGALTLGAIPRRCARPRRVRSVQGTAVLVCEEAGKSRLYLADARGAWHEEALLDIPADGLKWVTSAPDGTLLIQRCHFDSERRKKEGSGYLCGEAHVRRPLKLGAAAAWRRVRVSDALTYRPLSGGRALVVDRVGAGNDAIALLVDGPRKTRTLARKIKLTQDLQNLYVEQGRIVVKLGSYGEHVLTRQRTFERLPAP